jgi:Fe-Mn family superoxide dismutase
MALRNLLFQSALAIHGSGWVWIVAGRMGNLRVLATFNAGSPFDLAARQSTDPNTGLNVDSGLGPMSGPGPEAKPNRRQEYLLLPVLGLNVWEHAYVVDYGCTVEGKREYLKNWWASINWRRVYDAVKRRQESLISAPRQTASSSM